MTQITFTNGSFFNVGKGVLLTYTNLDTGKTYTVDTSGSVDQFIQNPDGTITWVATGKNGLIFGPSDVTGPRITQYTGRIVVTVSSSYTALSVDATSGQAVDVCQALS